MTESLFSYLQANDVDSDTVQQAARYYLAERTGDLSPREMREQIEAAASKRTEIDLNLAELERDPLRTENAFLAVLSSAWEEEGEAEKIKSAIADAKAKLPVIEMAILAIVAMYGMYLYTTGGITKKKRTVERLPDGTLREAETTELHDPGKPLGTIVALFGSAAYGSSPAKPGEHSS